MLLKLVTVADERKIWLIDDNFFPLCLIVGL